MRLMRVYRSCVPSADHHPVDYGTKRTAPESPRQDPGAVARSRG
jgi:hypothetical protein